MLIEISDEVWKKQRDSCALFGYRTQEEAVELLNDELWAKSCRILEDAERHLLSDTPEAYARREIGREKERAHGIIPVDEKDEKTIRDNLLQILSEHPEVLKQFCSGASVRAGTEQMKGRRVSCSEIGGRRRRHRIERGENKK